MSDVRKRQEFPVVALFDVGQMPAPGEDDKEAARVFYVAATQRLVMGATGNGMFRSRIAGLLETQQREPAP